MLPYALISQVSPVIGSIVTCTANNPGHVQKTRGNFCSLPFKTTA
jgi:hypothetical protein